MDHVNSLDGTPIAVWRSGSGPPLLLVHGTGGDHTRWTSVLPGFERFFTVYTLDRRGRGGSGGVEVYSLEQEGQDIAAVVDWIGEPVNVLGHSHGAVCSLEAALVSDNIRSLVLYEPPLPDRFLSERIVPIDVRARLDRYLEQGDRESIVLMLVRAAGATDEQIKAMRGDPSWPGRVAIAHTVVHEMHTVMEDDRPDFVDRFRAIQAPTLHLLGGDSPAFAREIATLLDATIPNSRIYEIPDQGHLANQAVPDEFVEIVQSFILS